MTNPLVDNLQGESGDAGGRETGKVPSRDFETQAFEKDPGMLTKKVTSNDLSDESFKHKGRVIDNRYRIDSVIGAGGQCTVLKARDLLTGEKVAIKHLNQLPSGADHDQVLVRFLNEAKAIGNLRHGDIIQVKTTTTDDLFGPLIVLEYVEGKNLGELIKEKVLEPKLAAKLFIRIGKAISHAHNRSRSSADGEANQDIIHRDIKPSNILIGNQDKFYQDPGDTDVLVKIADFGLGKFLNANQNGKSKGTTGILGTPNYMSPEQMREEEATKASDIYSLGATLYETLTKRPPFTATSYGQLFKQVQENDPTPPHVVDPSIPGQLSAICIKCLEKKPANRYERVDDFISDLGKFLQGDRNTIARPESYPSKIWKVLKRNPLRAGAVAVTLTFAVVVTAAVSIYLDNKRTREEKQVLETFLTASENAIKKLRDNIEKFGNNKEMEKIYADLQEYYRVLGGSRINGAVASQRKVAEANFSLAEIIERYGTPIKGIEAYDKAIEDYKKLGTLEESPDSQLKMALALGKKGWLLTQIRDFPAAKSNLDEAERIAKSLGADQASGDTVRESDFFKAKGLIQHYLANLENNQAGTAKGDSGANSQKVIDHYTASIAYFQSSLEKNRENTDSLWFLARGYGFRGDVFLRLKTRVDRSRAESDYTQSHMKRLEYLKSFLKEPELIRDPFKITTDQLAFKEEDSNQGRFHEAILQLNRSFGNFAELNYNLGLINSAIYFSESGLELCEYLWEKNKNDYNFQSDYLSSLNRHAFYKICVYYSFPEEARQAKVGTELLACRAELKKLSEKLDGINKKRMDALIVNNYRDLAPDLIANWIRGKMLQSEIGTILGNTVAYEALRETIKQAEVISENSKNKINDLGYFCLARIYSMVYIQFKDEQAEKSNQYLTRARQCFRESTINKSGFDFDSYFLRESDPYLADIPEAIPDGSSGLR